MGFLYGALPDSDKNQGDLSLPETANTVAREQIPFPQNEELN
jgi:hypothetical protein